MTAPDLGSEAFHHAINGRLVFRLAAGSKMPMADSRSLLDATREVDVVRAWWAQTRRANIGIACGSDSGFWALDFDPRHNGDTSFHELQIRYGEFPKTAAVVTPNDGLHLWWRWPEGGPEIRNSVSRVAPGVDVRGNGGYIIAPPSVLRGGGTYRWIRDRREILPAPQWLIDLALPPPPPPQRERKPHYGDVDRYCAAAIADELRQLAQAQESTRNHTLNKVAFSIAGFVLAGAVPEDWAIDKLEAIAVDIGLPLPEIRATIRSAFIAAHPREIAS